MNYSTPLYSLTVGQYVEMHAALEKLSASPKQDEEPYVYGLRGIMQLFGVSHKTAQAWKNTFLAPACSQVGRTIIVNRNKAIELFEATGRAAMESYGL